MVSFRSKSEVLRFLLAVVVGGCAKDQRLSERQQPEQVSMISSVATGEYAERHEIDANTPAKISKLSIMENVQTLSLLERKGPGPGREGYFPLLEARRRDGQIHNREAPIPVQCYTKTEGESNPCWTCHVNGTYPNLKTDWDLQTTYSFSNEALQNHWSNLFIDRSDAIARIEDNEVLSYIRQDNYAPLREVLEGQTFPTVYRFDLDFHQGFDDEGFALDGSGWRAFIYKPFVGTFWPTNGSTDDVIIRLPEKFRTNQGQPSLEVYKANLALLEASIASDPNIKSADVRWPVEPLNERAAGIDLDGDGRIEPQIEALAGLPDYYVGDAATHRLFRGTYPEGTEFLHSVRYIDPDSPRLISHRMKELRYARKEHETTRRFYFSKYAAEVEEKAEGGLPSFGGSPETGLLNTFGWRLQGYIEDADGRLRLQTLEEHYFCMGCHTSVGVTADSTFALPRKVPGKAGWGYQDLSAIPDVPQIGHDQPETLTYFERVHGGDELRANTEILERFFPKGILDEAEVRRAAPGGDRKLPFLIAPSRERALLLNKAYMALVKTQTFELGRDTVITTLQNVHQKIENGSTGLAEAKKVYNDGTLRLDWTHTDFWKM